jgi:hypothetical protein
MALSRRGFLVALGAAAVSLAAGCGAVASLKTPAGTAGELDSLRLVNWYPHDAGWSRLWTDASEAEIAADFAGIAALGANAVRVIVNTDAFGYPVPQAAMRSKLEWILAAASRHGLRVQLTLFDFWGDYADIATSVAWMRMVLAPYRDDRRLCFVEVQNEVDPRDQQMLIWLSVLYPATKVAAGTLPVTVSVTSGIGLAEIRRWVAVVKAIMTIDFFDFHWYGERGDAREGIAAMKAACGPTPLFIGETGRTAQPSGAETAAEGEAAQADYLTEAIMACRSASLPLPSPWIWQDFTAAALPFVGDQTGQLYFGLLRLDGSRTPAYSVVERAFRPPYL